MSCPHGNHPDECDNCAEEIRQWKLGYESQLKELHAMRKQRDVAIATLEGLGYTYHGGEQWKPPISQSVPPPPEPLSNNHIYKLKNEHPSSALAFARAIEKAHGINPKETS